MAANVTGPCGDGPAQFHHTYTVPSIRLVKKNRPRRRNAMKNRHATRLSLYAGIMTSGKLAVETRMTSW